MLAPVVKVSSKPEGKTVLTEISTNYRPIGLNFGTQLFLSMMPALATTDTFMAMIMMAMAMMAIIGKLFSRYLHKSLIHWAKLGTPHFLSMLTGLATMDTLMAMASRL